MKHTWKAGLFKAHPIWVCCEKCGIVQNLNNMDSDNCKGVVKVTLRTTLDDRE